MTRNFTKQNIIAKPTYPFFTSFCVGLASSCLAASLLFAPCGVTDAQATTADDLGLTGDIQVNLAGNTIDEVIKIEDIKNNGVLDKTSYIGMGVVSHELHHKTSIANKGTITLIDPAYEHDTLFYISGMYASHQTSIPCFTRDVIEATNEGNITIKVTSTALSSVNGIEATNHHANSYIVINNDGSIDLEGPHTTQGIYSHIEDNLGSIKINNTGTITVKGNGTASSYGIHSALAQDNRHIDPSDPSSPEDTNVYTNIIHNSNVISVDSINGAAEGIFTYTKNYDISQIINTGTIKTTSLNNDARAMYIYHINKEGKECHLAYNYGTIESHSTNGRALGIWTNGGSYGILYANIVNTGTINATSATSAAYGIVVAEKTMNAISNTGVINVSGKTAAHELYVYGGTAVIDTWTVTLRDYKDEKNNFDPFGIQSGQLMFLDKPLSHSGTGLTYPPTTFIVTAGTTEEGFAFNKEFPIQDMIRNDGGTIVGAVGVVESAVPFLKAELLHGKVDGTSFESLVPGADDSGTEQTIIIRTNVDTGTSPGHEAEEQIVTGLTQNMNMLSSILDTQLDYDEMPEDWRAFAVPYYTHGVNYDYGYNTDVMGIALGATHRVNDNFSAGMHLNFATIDSESAATTNDALMAGLGVHAKYHVTEGLHIRGQVTGFVMENRLGLSMNAKPEKVMAKVDTTSLGMYAAMFAAYDYKANEHHTFTPEVALKYVYAQHDGYDTDWHTTAGAPVDLDISYGDTSFDALYAEASLRWKGNYDLGVMENGKHRGVLHPTMRAGVRQALMGAEVESNLRYNEFDFGTTTSHANQTSVLFEGGLEWVYGDTTTSLSYIADFGNTEESHMGMLKIEFEF